MKNPPVSPTTGRLVSLDVLRGFDMFWILGMEELAEAVGHASNAPWAQFMATQLSHQPWAGFHFLDLIFPLFVFIAGVSLVFSLGKSVAERGHAATVRKLLIRALVLYLLGLFCYGGISKGIDHIRWLGVLQRIAISYLGAGLAFVYLGKRTRIGLCVGLLLGYWALMTFVAVPGFGAGDFAETHNLANWIDKNFLAGHKWDGDHDPEGLLSTLPAFASALLGVFAGEWLKRGDRAPMRKVVGLLGAGAALVLAGWLWHLQFPVIKKLWTSSFVLVAGGYSCLLLGAFFWVIDVRGWKKWATPFIWIGMNPITLYMLVSQNILNVKEVTNSLAGGPVAAAFGQWQEVWLGLVGLGLSLLLAWFLYSRKIFLRV